MYSQSYYEDTCSTIFIAELFIISRTFIKPKCLSPQLSGYREHSRSEPVLRYTPNTASAYSIGFQWQRFLPNNSMLHSPLSINA